MKIRVRSEKFCFQRRGIGEHTSIYSGVLNGEAAHYMGEINKIVVHRGTPFTMRNPDWISGSKDSVFQNF